MLQIIHYFDPKSVKCYYDDTIKDTHLTQILNNYPNIAKNEILYFDDDPSNIKTGIKHKIISCLIDFNIGVDYSTIVQNIQSN